MQAPAKPDIPIITAEKLAEPDGILFGLPTRFGTVPAQIKALLDASGALWAKGALVGKFAGTFFSTASQHGGQETTALTAVTYFAHQGMMYIPFGFAHPALSDNQQVIGGSAYGAGTITNGDGSRQPSELELSIAKSQGENFATIISTFVKGRANKTPTATTASALKTSDAATANLEKTTAPTDTVPPTNDKATSVGAAAGAVAAGAAVTGAAATAASNAKNDATTTTTGATTGATTGDIAGTATGTAVKDTATTAGTTAKDTATTGASTVKDNGTTATIAGSSVKENATTAATDNVTAAKNNATETAKKIGKEAGETAAGATSSVPTNLKDNTPKKKSKWWCCGGF